jgi:hypothetical protein
MKKTLLLFTVIAVAVFMTPARVLAQTHFANLTTKQIMIRDTTKSFELDLDQGKKCLSSFGPKDGKFTFDLYYMEGAKEVYAGRLTREVISNRVARIAIVAGDLYGIAGNPTGVKNTKVNLASAKQMPTIVTNNNATAASRFHTNVVLMNSSDYTFAVVDGAFSGLALKPGQESINSVSVPLGQTEFTVKRDAEKDGQNSGRKYSQYVYSGIIPLGAKKIEVKNENLIEIGGTAIKTYARSAIPFKIVFTGGIWKGKALGYRQSTPSATLNEGFNSVSIQYIGPKGQKMQADLEFIVTPGENSITFREADLKNVMELKR